MGQNDREDEKRWNKRAKAKAARARRASAQGDATYATVEWLSLVALVEAFTREQGAIRLGLTRDGGAYAIGVYLGDDYATEYVKPAEEFGRAIGEIAEAWLPDQGAWFYDRLIDLRASAAT